MLAALPALAAAGGYGTANFLGGLASRRQHAAMTLLISQTTALPIVCVLAAAGSGRPALSGLGVVAGLFAFCGAACAYLCFSLGRPVGVAAVLLGTSSAAVPVLVGVMSGSRLGPVAIAGLVVGGGAVVVLGWPERTATDLHAALLAVTGGLMFGGYHALMSQTAPATGMWPLVASQTVVVALAAALTVALGLRPAGGAASRMSVADGAASTAATVAALVAVRGGSLPAVGTLIALSPAVTTLLAWVLVREHLEGRRLGGLALALAAIACLTVRGGVAATLDQRGSGTDQAGGRAAGAADVQIGLVDASRAASRSASGAAGPSIRSHVDAGGWRAPVIGAGPWLPPDVAAGRLRPVVGAAGTRPTSAHGRRSPARPTAATRPRPSPSPAGPSPSAPAPTTAAPPTSTPATPAPTTPPRSPAPTG